MAQKGRPKKTITLVKKQPVLTKAQNETLQSLQFSLGEIRRKLANLENDSDSLPGVMFNVGMVFKIADQAEDALLNFIDEINDDCDDDNEITF
jgi:hypothetical protein